MLNKIYYHHLIRTGAMALVLLGISALHAHATSKVTVGTLAGGSWGYQYPMGAVVDGIGNVYVADLGNNVIRMVTPGGLAMDSIGNLYVGDPENNLIRKITITK